MRTIASCLFPKTATISQGEAVDGDNKLSIVNKYFIIPVFVGDAEFLEVFRF